MEQREGITVSALYANILERLGFFLPQICDNLPKRSGWRMQGKLYRGKVSGSKSSVLTLAEVGGQERCFLRSDSGAVVVADGDIEAILGKLVLMLAMRQSFSIDGVAWEEKARLGVVNFGGEGVEVVLEVN